MTAVSVTVLATSAHAAPPQLSNKTITISFTATGIAKSPEGVQRGFSTQVAGIVYVSSAGRVFLRTRITNRGGSRGSDAGPGETKGRVSFQGNRMIGVVPFDVGAIEVRGGAFDSDNASIHDPQRTERRVALYLSPELRQIAAATNKQSLNLSAEMILKTLGRQTAGVGTTSAGVESVNRQLSKAGIDVERLRMADGSGLSRQTSISTADMTTLLRWAYAKPTLFRDVLSTLSVGGHDGTLAARMVGTAAEGNVFGKTGYMGGVRAISGYVRTRRRRVAGVQHCRQQLHRPHGSDEQSTRPNFNPPGKLQPQGVICRNLAANS